MHRILAQILLALPLALSLLGPSSAHAQVDDPCGLLDSVSYPIDRGTFQLGQDFGTASPRHQGRYHTGEDWFTAYGATRGQPVRAIGRGTVTFSSPSAWGIDGGVVVIRHRLPDGDYIYSQYGHIEQTDSVRFPARLSCVEPGQVLGVIGDARPAPHLHFEMRVPSAQNPGIADTPGPGYTRTDPRLLGWRRPLEMMTNLEAQLNRAYLWHTTLAAESRPAPPLVLNDNSLLVLDGTRLRRITNDGRVMWRVTVDENPVSLHGHQAASYLTYGDGRVILVDVSSGGFSLARNLTVTLRPPALPTPGGGRLHAAPDGGLVALGPDGFSVAWEAPNGRPFSHGLATPALIALATDDTLRLHDREGRLLGEAVLENGVALAQHADGSLIAYTLGGLWVVSPAGDWSLLLPDAPPGGQGHAVVMLPDGSLYLSDGQMLTAYAPGGAELWQARLPLAVTGDLMLTAYDNVLLLTGSGGQIVAARASGGFCGFTRIYGDERVPLWHDLGDDGVLRVNVGSQFFGFDWERFTAGC